MPRWITFDETTAARLQAPNGENFRVATGDALDAAIDSANAVAILPASAGEVLIARVRRATLAIADTEASTAVGYSAGGFLGLSDDPIYEEEPAAKHPWWKRILD